MNLGFDFVSVASDVDYICQQLSGADNHERLSKSLRTTRNADTHETSQTLKLVRVVHNKNIPVGT